MSSRSFSTLTNVDIQSLKLEVSEKLP